MERTFKDEEIIVITDMLSAGHYDRHKLVLDSSDGCFLINIETKKRYLDMLAGYSARIFSGSGKYYERLWSALSRQKNLTLVSGSFYTEPYANFCRKITDLCSMRNVLAMNTGAEAVETAMKIAKRWAYLEKGVPDDKAEIISCTNNFHGRTQGVLSLSTNESHRKHFGPFLPGCKSVPFGDWKKLLYAIDEETTAAFIVEPIQGEGGINVPPAGYLKKAQEICNENNVLFILDEIQTGFGRTGTMFAHQAEGIEPDELTMLILGKALGGGILPISAVLASDEVMGVLNPGSHGSTFGGNPLACSVACEVIDILQNDQDFVPRARKVGEYFIGELKKIKSDIIKGVRGRGLLIGIELYGSDEVCRDICEELLEEGIICAVTHGNVLRFSPPLSITREEIDWALPKIKKVLEGEDEDFGR